MANGTPSGSNAVPSDQANISVPMVDPNLSNGMLHPDWTFKLGEITSASMSDPINSMKVNDTFLRSDGPDKSAGAHMSAQPPGGE